MTPTVPTTATTARATTAMPSNEPAVAAPAPLQPLVRQADSAWAAATVMGSPGTVAEGFEELTAGDAPEVGWPSTASALGLPPKELSASVTIGPRGPALT